MHQRMSKANMVLVLGLIGILAVFLTIISDFILIGRPNSGYSFLKLGTESMADIAHWRISFGVFFGIVVLPFQIAGLISVYHGLKQLGGKIPLMVVIINAHTLIMGVAFHFSYAFIGSGWKSYYETGPSNAITTGLVHRFDFYWKIIVIIMFVELLFSSICFTLLIMTGRTLYPKWMAIFNPLCVLIIMFPIIFAFPIPVGGFIGPAFFNISTMVFFILSTVVIYRKLLAES